MSRTANKFGVFYHGYMLTLDDGSVKMFDMVWEKFWGDVRVWNVTYNHIELNEDGEPYGCQNDGRGGRYIGCDNKVVGCRKIVKVHDDAQEHRVDPFVFLRQCERYTSYYFEGIR